jgi:hypothetical protein
LTQRLLDIVNSDIRKLLEQQCDHTRSKAGSERGSTDLTVKRRAQGKGDRNISAWGDELGKDFGSATIRTPTGIFVNLKVLTNRSD